MIICVSECFYQPSDLWSFFSSPVVHSTSHLRRTVTKWERYFTASSLHRQPENPSAGFWRWGRLVRWSVQLDGHPTPGQNPLTRSVESSKTDGTFCKVLKTRWQVLDHSTKCFIASKISILFVCKIIASKISILFVCVYNYCLQN